MTKPCLFQVRRVDGPMSLGVLRQRREPQKRHVRYNIRVHHPTTPPPSLLPYSVQLFGLRLPAEKEESFQWRRDHSTKEEIRLPNDRIGYDHLHRSKLSGLHLHTVGSDPGYHVPVWVPLRVHPGHQHEHTDLSETASGRVLRRNQRGGQPNSLLVSVQGL